ncbi:MAG: DUF4258 domain-containing protein [Chitinophagales bacterium]
MANSSTKKASSIVAILAAILLLILQQFGVIDTPNQTTNEQRPPSSINGTQTKDTVSEQKTKEVVSKLDKKDIPPKTSAPIDLDKTAKVKPKPKKAPQTQESDEQTAGGVLAELGQKKLIYTRHAECRMDCRYISESEIKDILKRGKINHRKSKPYDAPCPSYAVEGITKDNQEVRIVFAKCDYATKVITAIDLERKYSCHCD